ncbi:MAG TPA: hypothetical protein VF702_13875 [Allosphingosinicella sp.]
MASAALPSPALPEDGAEAWDELSPDGRTLVRWQLSHGRMSHMIVTPACYDAETGAAILRLDSGFDAQLRWLDHGRFSLHLRHYWRRGAAAIEIDRKADRFRLLEDAVPPGPGPWVPIERLHREVEARFPSPARAALAKAGRAPHWRIPAGLLLAALAAAVVWRLSW